MKTLPLALAATLLLSASAQARDFDVCDFESEFDLRLGADTLTFTRESGAPATVEMRRGTLRVDGREVALSDADRKRVQRYERTVRALVPEVKAIALDAVAIATDAVSEVASTFAERDSGKAVARIRQIGAELQQRIERSRDSGEWNEHEFDRLIGTLSAEVVPMLVGDVTAVAWQVALSGDDSAVKEFEQRADRMGKEIERRVEQRADELEARAQALCPQVAELDAIETSLQLRLADNRAIDLIQRQR